MSVVLVPLLQLVSLLFIARAVLSWLSIGPDSSFYSLYLFVHRLTEPVLVPVRRVLPRTGPLDLSVFAVLVVISLVLTPIAASL